MDYSITVHFNGEYKSFPFDKKVRDDKFSEIEEGFESISASRECVTLTTEDAKNEKVGVSELHEGKVGEVRFFAREDLKGIIQILEK